MAFGILGKTFSDTVAEGRQRNTLLTLFTKIHIKERSIVKKRFIPHVEAERRSLPSGPKMPQRCVPLNRVHPVKFTTVTAKRISLGDPTGVQLGLNTRPI